MLPISICAEASSAGTQVSRLPRGFQTSFRNTAPMQLANSQNLVAAWPQLDVCFADRSTGFFWGNKVFVLVGNFGIIQSQSCGYSNVINRPFLMVYTTHKNGDYGDGLLLLYQHY